MIVDAQHHEITPALEWDIDDPALRYKLMTEVLLGWMDAVGIDAALVNPVDQGFGRVAQAASPDRIALFDHVLKPDTIDVETVVAGYAEQPGMVALRTSFGNSREDQTGAANEGRFRAGVFDGLFEACQEHGLALFCSAYGHADLIGDAAERFPDLKLVVDHMGIPQPPILDADSPPWLALDTVVPIARYPNIYVKVTAAPVMSTEQYPYPDLWPHLHRLVEAYGPERLMWASDAGRFYGRIGWQTLFPEGLEPYPGKHTYAQSLFFIQETDELSAADKERILGGTVRRLVGWPSD
jgi:L-fuconolactonase